MAVAGPESLNRSSGGCCGTGPGRRSRTGSTSTGRRSGGRLLLPVLAGPLAAASATAGWTPARPGGPVLRYHEHVLPLRPGTADLPLPDCWPRQHYRLADWRPRLPN